MADETIHMIVFSIIFFGSFIFAGVMIYQDIREYNRRNNLK